jgi:hypothetical protein
MAVQLRSPAKVHFAGQDGVSTLLTSKQLVVGFESYWGRAVALTWVFVIGCMPTAKRRGFRVGFERDGCGWEPAESQDVAPTFRRWATSWGRG